MNENQPYTADDILTTLRVLGIDLETESFSSMLDELPIFLWVHDENNIIVYGNSEFKENFGTCVKQKCHQSLMGKKKTCGCCISQKVLRNNNPERCKLCKRRNNGYDINIFHTPITNRKSRKYILKSSFHIKDLGILAESLYQDKPDNERKEIFLVMCSSCNRAKDQDNNWSAIDTHILDYFNVRISHGICPDCADRLYPEWNRKNTHTHISP